METILTGRLERGHGSSMKGVDERNDLETAFAVFIERVLSRKLNRTFVGLCARVGKEHLAVQMRLFDQLFRNLNHRLGREQVGNMHQLVCLLGYRVDDLGIVVSHAVDADARSKIDILFAFHIPQRRTLTVVERDRKTAVGVHHILIFLGLQLLICHFFRFFLTGTSCRHRLY